MSFHRKCWKVRIAPSAIGVLAVDDHAVLAGEEPEPERIITPADDPVVEVEATRDTGVDRRREEIRIFNGCRAVLPDAKIVVAGTILPARPPST